MSIYRVTYQNKVKQAEGRDAEAACKRAFRAPPGSRWVALANSEQGADQPASVLAVVEQIGPAPTVFKFFVLTDSSGM